MRERWEMDIFPRIGVLLNDAIGTGKNSGRGGVHHEQKRQANVYNIHSDYNCAEIGDFFFTFGDFYNVFY